MADVANCMKSSTPRKANFGQILSDAADDILSPEVREAMDRIFPQSASQFLQGGMSFEEDAFLSIASSGVDRDEQHAKPLFTSAGSTGIATLSSMGAEKATSEPAVAVSAGAVTSLFWHSLAVTAVSSVVTASAVPSVVTADSKMTATEANTCQTREAAAVVTAIEAKTCQTREAAAVVTAIEANTCQTREAAAVVTAIEANTCQTREAAAVVTALEAKTCQTREAAAAVTPTEAKTCQTREAAAVVTATEANTCQTREAAAVVTPTEAKTCQTREAAAVVTPTEAKTCQTREAAAVVTADSKMTATEANTCQTREAAAVVTPTEAKTCQTREAAAVVTADSKMTATEANTCQTREAAAESDSKQAELQKSTTSKTQISKADFETLTSYDAVVSSCERTSRSVSNTDIVSDNDNSGDDSDSEDMSRPFASITREKKKKKRKKVLTEPHKHQPAKSITYLSEHNVNSGDEFKISPKSWNSYNNSEVHTGSGDRIVENDSTAEVNTQNELLSTSDLSEKSTQSCNQNNYNGSSNGYSIAICPVKDLYKDGVTTNEDISNTSNSSIKENVVGRKRFPRQKLPKVKRDHFHIVRHVNKITNTFPPCCVVLRKIHTRLVYNVSNLNVIDNVLSLADRVRCLQRLCDKGYLICKKNRKIKLAEKLGCINFFEEAILPGTSDDEFEKPQKRSLRKRAKKISYVEPCEDDIMEEFSSKRSLAKCKDGSLGKSRNESTEKPHVSPISDAKHETEGSENNKRYHEYAQYIENNNHRICNKEQHIYPPSNMTSASVYKPSSAEVSQHMYSHLNNQKSSDAPFLSYLSGLSGAALPAIFPHVPSFFPSLPMSISGSLPTHSYIEQAPFSYPVSSTGHDPQQLCLLKNGNDVYMQLFSSAGVGSGGLGASMPAVLPTGKTLGIPPGPNMFSQPLPQVNSVPFSTQAMFRPPVSVVSVTNGSMMSPASVQMSSFYRMLNRPAQSASHHIPLTSYSHGPSHMNMAVVKPTPHTSYAAPSSSGLSAAVTLAASTRTSTFMTSTSSSAQAVPIPFVPISVPYISSIQSTSMPTPSSHSRGANIPHLQYSTAQSHGPERYANLSNLYSQSHFPTMLNHIAERLTSIPSPVSQSRVPNLPSPVPQSRIPNLPSPISQSRSNIPSPISQSRMPNLPSPVSQSRIHNLPSPIPQSRIPNIPSPISQSRSNIPSPIPQSRIHNIPSPISQSRSNIPSPMSQSRTSSIQSPVSQSRTSSIQSPVLPPRAHSTSNQSSQPTANHISPYATNFPSLNSQQWLPDQPASACPTRTLVPGYPATITPGCVATLGGSASLLALELSAGKVVLPQQKGYSELSASKVVLPQQKGYSELSASKVVLPQQKGYLELSDQHAAKRRRLEQKYPLPPGVIIKTERLESPAPSPMNNAPQSLLSQNSQLLSTLMPRHCAQSKIINPSAPNTMSVQNFRSSSEVPNMTACLGGSQPGLDPTSLGLARASPGVTSADFSTLLLGSSSAGSATSWVAMPAATTKNIDRFYTSSSSLNTTAAVGCHSYSRFPQVYPPTTQQSLTNHIATGTSNAVNCITPASAATLVQPKAPNTASFESSSSASLDIAARPSPSPSQALPPPAPPRAPAVTESMPSPSLQQYPSRISPQAAALNSFRNSLKELEMFVQGQESCGLRSERLDKLQELWFKKCQQYKELKRFVEASTASESGNRSQDSEGDGINIVPGEPRGGSEAEPFVID